MQGIPPRDIASDTQTPLRALLAEDDPELRALLTLALERASITVVPCENGGRLLDELEGDFEAGGVCGFDVIVSDVRMPGPNGLELLDALREHDWLPPFVLVTAYGAPSLHRQALELGAAAVLDKPVEIAVLVKTVRRVVNERCAELAQREAE